MRNRGNYAVIKYFCISNGDGLCTAIYLSGCDFHCKGCFNFEIWNHKCGELLTDDVIDGVLDSIKPPYINHLSILGGEPLDDINKHSTYELVYAFRQRYPNTIRGESLDHPKKKLWLWSGYKFEILKERAKTDGIINYILNNVDILVDGQFEEDKKDLNLKYAGSTNQRPIMCKQSIKENKLILYKHD